MEIFGLSETIEAIQEEADKIIKKAEAAVRLAGQAYANDVKALAPYLSGTYRRSIHVEKIIEESGKFYAIVGTNLPQALRLEYGFYDAIDALGRHYYQLPLPHFRPPLDTEMDRYVAIMQGAIDDALYDREAGMSWAEDQISDIRPDLLARSGMSSSNFSRSPPKARKKVQNIWAKVSVGYGRTSTRSKPVRK